MANTEDGDTFGCEKSTKPDVSAELMSSKRKITYSTCKGNQFVSNHGQFLIYNFQSFV